MTDKHALPVVLNGTPKSPEALAKIFWMKNTGQVYIDPSNLPAVPEGKQYQLWAIVDGKPVDARNDRNRKRNLPHTKNEIIWQSRCFCHYA